MEGKLSQNEVDILKTVSHYKDVGFYKLDEDIVGLLDFDSYWWKQSHVPSEEIIESLHTLTEKDILDSTYSFTPKGKEILKTFSSISKL